MPIRSIGDFASAARMARTYYKKNHAGEELAGVLAPDKHVRFNTVFFDADHVARYGFSTRDGVGSFVGERYSADLVRQVINHASNPLGWDPAALPYEPTEEDAQDCKLVAGLNSTLLDIGIRLLLAGAPSPSTPTPPTPPTPTTPTSTGKSPDQQRVEVYEQHNKKLGGLAAMFDGEIPEKGGGKYAEAARVFLAQLIKLNEQTGKDLAGIK